MLFPFKSYILQLDLAGLIWFQLTQTVGVKHAKSLVEISIIISVLS